MNIKEIINKERWKLLPHHLTRVKQHNASLDRIEAAYQKEYAEWQEGDERLRRMHEEHLGEYDKRIAELEQVLRWLDIQGGLGYEKHDRIKKVLGGEAWSTSLL